MAKILQENPLSNEAQSPLIAGLSEGISKLSEILDLKVGTFTDLQLSNIYISAEDKNRIYEAPDGKRLWLNSPEIVVKKNGTAITQSTGHFSIDYVGGSITFESGYTLNDSDIVTVSASYIVAESKTIDDIKSLLNDTNNLALRYKGFYANESSLTSVLPNGVNGEFAFVLSPNFAFYAWDSASNTWKNTQSIEELSNFYTKTETDNLLKSKEPTITAKGATSNDDNYYWGGRKTWVDIFTKVRNVVLTGLSTTTKSAISATDTVLTALGKLQAQITELSNTKGDMSKSVYDKDLSGIVDDSEMLGGQLPSYYATAEAANNAQTTADSAVTKANAAQSAANNAMPKSGGTFTGGINATLTGNLISPYGREKSANAIPFVSKQLVYFIATSSMTEGKPPKDACVLHMNWDNSPERPWAAQLALSNGSSDIYFRGYNADKRKWESWETAMKKSQFSVSGSTLNISI